MAGRKPHKIKTEKFQKFIPALLMEDLRWLAGEGYGSSEAEVGQYLMQLGVDQLKRDKIIPPKQKRREQKIVD